MRLLTRKQDNDEFELVTFSTDDLPRYAILSHTWTDGEEVTYDELMAGAGKGKAGYTKIRFCGERAAQDGIQYFWVDTCCINKNSSAELSESINSMYRWYQQADVCYAYIEDWPSELTWADLASVLPVDDMQSCNKLQVVRTATNDHESEEHISLGWISDALQSDGRVDEEQMHESNEGQETKPEHAALKDTISQAHMTEGIRSHDRKDYTLGGKLANADSVQAGTKNDDPQRSAQLLGSTQSKSRSAESSPLRWFTRGWTLQELIAPKKMEFFDGNGKARGMKSDPLIIENLSRITGIAPSVLSDSSEDSLRGTCYGQRMSWAAYRDTSRKEDIAYCLLGIFQINMPLIYGEGVKAFTRLQEKILASSTDLSLLAWTQNCEDTQQYRGIFSCHPHEFRGLGQCRQDYSQFSTPDEVIMTNKGARIETSIFHLKDDDGEILPDVEIYFLSLGCYIYDDYLQGIFLKKMKDFHVRAEPDGLMRIDSHMIRAKAQTIYLARDFAGPSNLHYHRSTVAGIEVKLKAPKPYALNVAESWPHVYFDTLANTFVVGHLTTFVGYLLIHITDITPTDIEHKRGPIARFMAVISKGGNSNVLVNVLSEDQAEKFKTDIQLICKMDPRTVHKNLASRLAHLWRNLEPAVAVQDHVTGSILRLDGKTVDGKQKLSTESGETFAAKAVRISINVDTSQEHNRLNVPLEMPHNGVSRQTGKESRLSRGLAKLGVRRLKA